MDLPNEIWYNVFSFLTQQSKSKFSSLWNLHNLSTKEIKLIHKSDDLLIEAASYDYVKLIKLLIKTGGVDVNVQDIFDKRRLLHFVSNYGHKDIVELLIKAGAEVNVQCKFGNTPLHYASMDGHTECIELLIKAGADVNIQDSDGWTVLHFASYGGYKDIVDLLIKAGANVNLLSHQEFNTALHFASSFGHKDCVELLIKAGTDVNIKNKYGRTALDLESIKDNIKLLISHPSQEGGEE